MTQEEIRILSANKKKSNLEERIKQYNDNLKNIENFQGHIKSTALKYFKIINKDDFTEKDINWKSLKIEGNLVKYESTRFHSLNTITHMPIEYLYNFYMIDKLRVEFEVRKERVKQFEIDKRRELYEKLKFEFEV